MHSHLQDVEESTCCAFILQGVIPTSCLMILIYATCNAFPVNQNEFVIGETLNMAMLCALKVSGTTLTAHEKGFPHFADVSDFKRIETRYICP